VTSRWLVLVESNTTGSGRLFAAAARRLGLRPVMLARDPDRYPYVRADQIDSKLTDTADPAAVLAACTALPGPVAGVLSSSEYFIATAAEAASALGLPHPDPAAVRRCRDKRSQRQCLAAAGLPGPGFASADSPEAAVTAAARIGLPVVVKPVAGSGSIGVRRCGSLAQAAAAARYVLAADQAATGLPPQPAVLVERYLPGPEYSVELLGDQVVGVTRKHLGPEPFFVETGHDFPAPLAAAGAAAVSQCAAAALAALGLRHGAAHVELRLTPAGPVVVEVNPRLAGGMIPRMVQEATGIDMIFHLVAAAAGQDAAVRPARAAAASIRFLIAGECGQLAGITGVDEARQLPGVTEVGLTATAGQQVTVRHSFRDRLGYVIGAGHDTAAAAGAAESGLRALAAQIVPAPAAAEGSLR
jgi:argininosuccinate lyase